MSFRFPLLFSFFLICHPPYLNEKNVQGHSERQKAKIDK
ncbi:hypothetical protein HMPREF9406_0683 [Clostridium sp. HGF2]|nr:hypothetical protein HMPREF9406_0683 [Clostridium sp. HGF2]EQJ58636.1 hypothetical protein QSI_1918 [Clostridioides difficile P28]